MPKRSIDTRLDFLSPLSLVPGLGSRRVAALKESGLSTIGDLLYHFPRRYVDRSTVVAIGDVGRHEDHLCTVVGTVTRTGMERGRRARLRVQVSDDTGSLEALWFHGVPYFRNAIRSGLRLCLTGKVTRYGGYQMVHPMTETVGRQGTGPHMPFLPVYAVSSAMRDAGLQQKSLVSAIQWVLANLKHYPQVLPGSIVEKKGFPSLEECLKRIHDPGDLAGLEPYKARLRYEELYALALSLRWSKRKFALPGRAMTPGGLVDTVRSSLAFSLTHEQDKALRRLLADGASDKRMHRLLQGDVGSGKTIVAFLACLPALNEGFQVAWLSPTEVLARQTAGVVNRWLATIGREAVLLMGGMSSPDRRRTRQGLLSGRLSFVVGTHAMLRESIGFHKLGMIVIDEQHRFGVEQRLALQEKDPAADFLLMSATPIPQTLARTLYGDLDVVTIASSPAGREPVATHIVPSRKRADMERFIRNQIVEEGAQAFLVVPRIDHGEDETVRDAASVYDDLRKGVLAGIPAGLVHGRQSSDELEGVMARFSAGDLKLLVATTVVEVGIDVPAAGVIVVENAERFGLCQLHQLRGRVGRGGGKAYCFLLAQETADGLAGERLRRFCHTHDGFEIAELDLSLRGPGEVAGFRQAGWDDLKIADILRDAALFREIGEVLEALVGR